MASCSKNAIYKQRCLVELLLLLRRAAEALTYRSLAALLVKEDKPESVTPLVLALTGANTPTRPRV